MGNKTLPVYIGDVKTDIEPDSGADVNLMDEHQFKALIHRSREPLNLQRSETKLYDLQRKLPVKGEFSTVIRNETCGTPAKFVVLQGRMNSPPLLSKETLMEHGMMQNRPDGSLASPNKLRIKTIRCENKEIQRIFEKYEKKVFQGIGFIKDLKKQQRILCKVQHEA